MQMRRGVDAEMQSERGDVDARHTRGGAEKDERIHLGSSEAVSSTNRLRHTRNAVLGLKANHRHPGLHTSGQPGEHNAPRTHELECLAHELRSAHIASEEQAQSSW